MAKQSRITEVSLYADMHREGFWEIVTSMLFTLGVLPTEVASRKERGRDFISIYIEAPDRAKMIVKRIRAIGFKNVEIKTRTFQRKDWAEAWKKDWAIFSLTKNLDIVPAWRRKEYNPGKKNFLILDTVSAFGTGMHETTKFMAEYIEELKGQYQTVLDIGTGTGILGMVALKCGAEEVDAIDIEASAVKVAQQNLKANQLSFRSLKRADLKKLSTKRQYDFVLANLVTHDLIEMRQKILSLVKPGGLLAISGISVPNYPLIKEGLKDLPATILKRKTGKEWTAILFRKKAR